jgi:hypothetical protein
LNDLALLLADIARLRRLGYKTRAKLLDNCTHSLSVAHSASFDSIGILGTLTVASRADLSSSEAQLFRLPGIKFFQGHFQRIFDVISFCWTPGSPETKEGRKQIASIMELHSATFFHAFFAVSACKRIRN